MARDGRPMLYALLGVAGLVGGWLASELYLSRAEPALRCPVVADQLTERASLWSEGEGTLERHVGTWKGDALVFTDLPEAGAGELEVPGYLPAPVRWADGRCEAGALEPAAIVIGSVAPTDGDIIVVGCDRQATLGPGGSFYLEVAPEPCALQAVRQDGAFATHSTPVDVRPVVGHDTFVDLTLPEPSGGIGVRFSVDERGVVVEGLFAGGAAEAADIEPGDRIVAIDGEPTVGMEMRDFASMALGPLGTEVLLVVEREGVEREVPLVRTAVAADDEQL